MKKNFILVALIGLLLILGCAGTQSNTSQPYKPISNSSTDEEKLVFLDINSTPQADNISVKRVKFLLDYLAEHTYTPRPEIADTVSKAVTMLENNFGKKIKNEFFLEESKKIVDILPKTDKKEDYKKISYLVYTNLSNK